MRLGINTLFLVPGDVGGTETYLRETLLACLQEFPDLQYILFTNNENNALLRTLCAGHNNVVFDCLGFNAANRPLRIILEQAKLPLAARKHRLDLLWSPGYTAPFFAPCPQAVTVHDLQYKSFPEDMSLLERITLDILVRFACFRCQAIIAISEFTRSELLKYGFTDERKVFTVLEGVDPSFAATQSYNQQQCLARLSLSPEMPFILCVAHTYPHKRVALLVEAFNQLLDRIPHVLVLVGRARRGDPAVLQAIERSPQPSRIIRFQEGLPGEDLRRLYQSADMFVLPSMYEGFGLPVLEAMMAGTPVITTSAASLPEIGGDHALYINSHSATELAEKIKQVHAFSQQDRKRHTDAAQAWAHTFTWQRSAQHLINCFRTVLNG
jgi:glycosyltransferase involved in cell wall biosynthesis